MYSCRDFLDRGPERGDAVGASLAQPGLRQVVGEQRRPLVYHKALPEFLPENILQSPLPQGFLCHLAVICVVGRQHPEGDVILDTSHYIFPTIKLYPGEQDVLG